MLKILFYFIFFFVYIVVGVKIKKDLEKKWINKNKKELK